MEKNEILEVQFDLAKNDLKKIGLLLENDESNKVLIAEYGFRRGIVEGLERAIKLQ